MSLALSEQEHPEIAEPAAPTRKPTGPAQRGDSAVPIAFDDYVAYRPHLFPKGAESGKWFLRKYGRELVEEGALLRLGRRYMVLPQPFDAFVMRAGRRHAAETVGRR